MDFRTHCATVYCPVVEFIDGDGTISMGCKVWQEYPNEKWRIRSCSPPGEAQDTSNWKTELEEFYIESTLANLTLLESDPDYIIGLDGIEEIPTDETL